MIQGALCPPCFFGVKKMPETTCVLKLKDDSDIMKELENLARDNSISYGLIVSGFGKLKEFELVSNAPAGGVNKMNFASAFELNAISGKVQIERGKFVPHIRVSVTSTGFTPVSGQLIRGKAAGKLEIGIRKIDTSRIIEA